MRVLKFGGTSVGSADRINEVIDLLEQRKEEQIVVLSAMSGTTNDLVQISSTIRDGRKEEAGQLLDEFEDKYVRVLTDLYVRKDDRDTARDLIRPCVTMIREILGQSSPFTEVNDREICAQGELISTRLFSHMCDIRGIHTALIPALNFISLNQQGEPDLERIEKDIQPYLDLIDEDCKILITQGYICRDHEGQVTNLKRGGSDYTATIIGSVVRASEVQIWTDIDGVHNNDPRVVQHTSPVRKLSYREAAELAYFGAKILHPTCVLPVEVAKVPLRLKCTMEPDALGTLISEEPSLLPVTAIASKSGIIALEIRSHRMLNAYGFLTQVFQVFEKYRTSVDMITTSEVSVSLTIEDDSFLDAIIDELGQIAEVEVTQNHAIVCIVGNALYEDNRYVKEIFGLLEDIPIRMVSLGGSRHNISVLIPQEDRAKALQNLHSLFLTTIKSLENA